MLLEEFARNTEEAFSEDVLLGLFHLPFKDFRRDGRLIDIKEGDVPKTNLMQDDDELDEVRVGLLPERFLALAK